MMLRSNLTCGTAALAHRFHDRTRRFGRRPGVEHAERRQQLRAIQRPAELELSPRVRLRPDHSTLQDRGSINARREPVLSPLDLEGDPLDDVVRDGGGAGGEGAGDDADGQRSRTAHAPAERNPGFHL